MQFHCQCGHIFKDSEARKEGKVSLCPKCGSSNFVEMPRGCFSALLVLICAIVGGIIGGGLIMGYDNPALYFGAVGLGVITFLQFLVQQEAYHRQITSEAWKNYVQNLSSIPALEVEVSEVPEQTFHVKSKQGLVFLCCQVFVLILILSFILLPLIPLLFPRLISISTYALILITVALYSITIPVFILFLKEMIKKFLDIDANGITYTSCSHWSVPWTEIKKIEYHVHDVFMFFTVLSRVIHIRVDLKDGKTHFKAIIFMQDKIQLEQMIRYIHEMARLHSIE